MADLNRPSTYLGKLQFAQRVMRTAQYRSDVKQSVRELCEGLSELIVALIEREEQERGGQTNSGQAEQKPSG
jgi:hypothetical protein